VLGVALALDFATKRSLVTWFKRLADRSETRWDNALVDAHAPDRLAHLAPALVIYAAAPFVFPEPDFVASLVQRVAMAFVIVTVGLAINGVLDAVLDMYRTSDQSRRALITTYIQVAQIVLAIIGAVAGSCLQQRQRQCHRQPGRQARPVPVPRRLAWQMTGRGANRGGRR
jgi:miniconductance mechanosensitive channel